MSRYLVTYVERDWKGHLMIILALLKEWSEVVTSKVTDAGRVLNSVTVESDLVSVHGDSLVIHSHKKHRRIGNS